MKYLLGLGLLIWVVWRWVTPKTPAPQPKPAPHRTDAVTHQEAMVRCSRCAVHVPEHESVAGKLGVYCSREHRQEAEP